MNNVVSSVQNEFWFHVSDQNEIPIAGMITKTLDIKLLIDYLKLIPLSESEIEDFLKLTISKNVEYIDLLRTLIGVSDKRMYLELSYLFSKTRLNEGSDRSICGCTVYNLNKHPLEFFKNLVKSKDADIAHKSLNLITYYFKRKGIFKILNSLRKLSEEEISAIVTSLILTKETQQEEAKRRGHGAEYELAVLLHELGCNLIPKDRHTKAMAGKDPNVDKETFQIRNKDKGTTWSFDTIIEFNNEPNIFIQSLIHTSDPGQYGVNKSDETVQIKRDLVAHNSKYKSNKELWGLVDGVGFSENKKDTIDKMLDEFDCFIQLKSLYKAALRLHQKGLVKVKAIRFDKNFYTEEIDIKAICEKYSSNDIKVVTSQEEGLELGQEIKAGKAWIYF